MPFDEDFPGKNRATLRLRSTTQVTERQFYPKVNFLGFLKYSVASTSQVGKRKWKITRDEKKITSG